MFVLVCKHLNQHTWSGNQLPCAKRATRRLLNHNDSQGHFENWVQVEEFQAHCGHFVQHH